MLEDIIIIGTGFAGLWSALSAQRLITLKGKQKELHVTVIAPQPSLGLRPRFYEADVATMVQPLGYLFDSAGIRFVQGIVDTIDTENNTVEFVNAAGEKATMEYKRLILAAGSESARPQAISGVHEYAFDVDTLSSAAKLESHLGSLSSLPSSQARDTIVVCGAGFTGLELATELPKRLGGTLDARIILVESSDIVGPELGHGARPMIKEALASLGIIVKLDSAVAAIDATGVHLASGEFIETKTAVWTAGVRATPLTQQVPGTKDQRSRLCVDEYLRVPSAQQVYATGDAACALADTDGQHALMSCQHAVVLGRISGYNAAAELLGEAMLAYSQPVYNTCLDLGTWGAVLTTGWEGKFKESGKTAKRLKAFINQTLIYAPEDFDAAMNAADPQGDSSDGLLAQVLMTMEQRA